VAIPITEFTSSSNYPTRLEFKLNEDSGLGALEVVTCRALLDAR